MQHIPVCLCDSKGVSINLSQCLRCDQQIISGILQSVQHHCGSHPNRVKKQSTHMFMWLHRLHRIVCVHKLGALIWCRGQSSSILPAVARWSARVPSSTQPARPELRPHLTRCAFPKLLATFSTALAAESGSWSNNCGWGLRSVCLWWRNGHDIVVINFFCGTRDGRIFMDFWKAHVG